MNEPNDRTPEEHLHDGTRIIPITPEKLLRLYAAGERCFVGIEMDIEPYGNFTDCILAGADFSESFIVADFSRTDLRGATFHNANLKTSNFTEAILTECDFRNAALCATSFTGASMTDAKFGGAYFHSCVLADGEVPDW